MNRKRLDSWVLECLCSRCLVFEKIGIWTLISWFNERITKKTRKVLTNYVYNFLFIDWFRLTAQDWRISFCDWKSGIASIKIPTTIWSTPRMLHKPATSSSPPANFGFVDWLLSLPSATLMTHQPIRLQILSLHANWLNWFWDTS